MLPTSCNCCLCSTRFRQFAACAAIRCSGLASFTPIADTTPSDIQDRYVIAIEPLIVTRRAGRGSDFGKYRCVVERANAWLDRVRRLRIRFAHRADIHGASVKLGCRLICWNTLRRANESL